MTTRAAHPDPLRLPLLASLLSRAPRQTISRCRSSTRSPDETRLRVPLRVVEACVHEHIAQQGLGGLVQYDLSPSGLAAQGYELLTEDIEWERFDADGKAAPPKQWLVFTPGKALFERFFPWLTQATAQATQPAAQGHRSAAAALFGSLASGGAGAAGAESFGPATSAATGLRYASAAAPVGYAPSEVESEACPEPEVDCTHSRPNTPQRRRSSSSSGESSESSVWEWDRQGRQPSAAGVPAALSARAGTSGASGSKSAAAGPGASSASDQSHNINTAKTSTLRGMIRQHATAAVPAAAPQKAADAWTKNSWVAEQCFISLPVEYTERNTAEGTAVLSQVKPVSVVGNQILAKIMEQITVKKSFEIQVPEANGRYLVEGIKREACTKKPGQVGTHTHSIEAHQTFMRIDRRNGQMTPGLCRRVVILVRGTRTL